MSLETYTGYIPALVTTNPANTDPKSQGAAHIRGTKLTLATTFSGFTEPNVGVTVKASQINAVCAQPVSSFVPAGAVMAFAMNTAPAGWLAANGAAVSRTTYATLFAAIGTTFGIGDGSTTFNVPNLLGQFVRGWNNTASGADANRVFGSAQAGDNAPHNHSGTTAGGGAHAHYGNTDPNGVHNHTPAAGYGVVYNQVQNSGVMTRPVAGGPNNLAQTPMTDAGSHIHGFLTDPAPDHTHTVTVTTTGVEARPVNIAMLYCIKV